ncbi:hypothetical protein [Geomicrobium sp. JCM 19039]|uniref:hypothetical protein n=1 Tax=Geomicrobium sp. JCM 19039 TaxID=1460636 RepID=UPI00045F371B|nr:hypothetical protein [Geomicrobium sp. JCM 19039]GAK12763.1 hypothetical protein JCM19039_2562 [Geomicrobium sp. JCM 19039]
MLDSGTSLDEAFLEGGIYTKEFPAIVRHGQEAGQLADDLVHYSEMLFEEMNERTKQLVFSIQHYVSRHWDGDVVIIHVHFHSDFSAHHVHRRIKGDDPLEKNEQIERLEKRLMHVQYELERLQKYIEKLEYQQHDDTEKIVTILYKKKEEVRS